MMVFIGSSIFAYVLLILILLIVSTLPFPYLALRLRDSREEERDPQLGVKTAYYLLLSGAIVLVLFGLTVAAIDLLDGAFQKPKQQQQQANVPPAFVDENEKEFKERTQRVAWSLVVAGLLFSLVIMVVIRVATNDAEFPAAKRIFVGGRLVLSGAMIMLAMTALIVLLFQKEAKEQNVEKGVTSAFEIITAVAIVWLPSTILHIVQMKMYAALPYHASRSSRRSTRRLHDDLDDE
jgi:hypothetical protein